MAKKILIVDDEATLTEVMRMCLETNGYEVFSADNGVKGLQLWEEKSPDLILLDCIMPEMDGAAFITESSQKEGLSPAPIIMLSAKDDACANLPSGSIAARLTKPCGYDELLDKIKEFIE